ncbi:MAG: hypothetical protein IH960_03530 [Chloroflexi bacterium]|nr:hypothetical protein [Chloroflexota bacterium]
MTATTLHRKNDMISDHANRADDNLNVRPVSHARSQNERNNPGGRTELKKRSDALKESERRKRGFGTVKPGVFAGERRKGGLIGAPPSTKLWTGSKQKRLFT